MSKFKRVTALLLAALMVLGSASLIIGAYNRSYDDVPESHNYYDEISILSDIRLLQGYADTNLYGESDFMTRRQICIAFARIINGKKLLADPDFDRHYLIGKENLTEYTDLDDCDDYYGAITLCQQYGLIQGWTDIDGQLVFGPNNYLTYSDVFCLCERLYYISDTMIRDKLKESASWPKYINELALDLELPEGVVGFEKIPMDQLNKVYPTRGEVAEILCHFLLDMYHGNRSLLKIYFGIEYESENLILKSTDGETCVMQLPDGTETELPYEDVLGEEGIDPEDAWLYYGASFKINSLDHYESVASNGGMNGVEEIKEDDVKPEGTATDKETGKTTSDPDSIQNDYLYIREFDDDNDGTADRSIYSAYKVGFVTEMNGKNATVSVGAFGQTSVSGEIYDPNGIGAKVGDLVRWANIEDAGKIVIGAKYDIETGYLKYVEDRELTKVTLLDSNDDLTADGTEYTIGYDDTKLEGSGENSACIYPTDYFDIFDFCVGQKVTYALEGDCIIYIEEYADNKYYVFDSFGERNDSYVTVKAIGTQGDEVLETVELKVATIDNVPFAQMIDDDPLVKGSIFMTCTDGEVSNIFSDMQMAEYYFTEEEIEDVQKGCGREDNTFPEIFVPLLECHWKTIEPGEYPLTDGKIIINGEDAGHPAYWLALDYQNEFVIMDMTDGGFTHLVIQEDFDDRYILVGEVGYYYGITF